MAGNDIYKDLSLIISEKQKVIDQLTKEKFSLLKIISHDIRAPFNQLFALVQLLEMESSELGPEMKSYIDKMYHSVIGGMEMIKNLHDMRSIDQESISTNPETFQVSHLLNQVIKQFKIQSRLKSITLNLKEDIDRLEIRSDKILLKKILENIISNAIKFSDPGTEVFIQARKDDRSVVIVVRDFGPGLPEDEIPQIFHKFKKLSTSPSEGEGTTGLGMFIADQFTVMLRGSIKVRSIKEGGLEVRLNVPLVLDHSE